MTKAITSASLADAIQQDLLKVTIDSLDPLEIKHIEEKKSNDSTSITPEKKAKKLDEIRMRTKYISFRMLECLLVSKP